MLRLNRVCKSTTCLIMISFILEQLSLASDLKPTEWTKNHDLRAWVGQLVPQIPDSVAIPEDAWKSPIRGKTIILIQDAHTNESAQINISRTLDLLLKKNNDIKFIFAEGAVGDNSLSYLKHFSAKETRFKIAASYLRKGLLHGAEYLNLTSERNFTIWGVENISLYKKSLQSYRMVTKQRERYENYLSRIEKKLKALKPRIYNPFLLSVDREHEKYLNNKLSITEYFDFLLKQAKIQSVSLTSYPSLEILQKLKDMESQIDFKKATSEQQKAVEALKSDEEDEIQELAGTVQKSPLKLRNDQPKEQGAFYALLEEKISNKLPNYPELSKYLDYLKIAQTVEAKKVLDELKILEECVFDSVSETLDEKLMLRCSKYLALLKKLLNLALTAEEFQEYKTASRDLGIVQLAGFINKKIMDLRWQYEEALFLEKGYEGVVKESENFYALTTLRDAAFIDGVLKKMTEAAQDKAILITGGYHGVNLKELMKQQMISFVSITPQIYKETNKQRYESILLNQNVDNRSTDVPRGFTTSMNMDTLYWVTRFNDLPPTRGTPNIFSELSNGARLATKSRNTQTFEEEIEQAARERRIPLNSDTKIALFIGGPHIKDGDYYQLFYQTVQNVFHERINLVYLPYPFEKDDQRRLELVNRQMKENDRVIGAVITRPHKEARFGLDVNGSQAGAINYITKNSHGQLIGDAIDAEAWIAGLRHDLHEDYDFSGRQLVVLGAGGAAKEIAAKLKGRRVRRIIFSDADPSQRVSMQNQLSKIQPDYSYEIIESDGPQNPSERLHQAIQQSDMVINATGIGRGTTKGKSPLADHQSLRGVKIASDLISNEDTQFLKEARKEGVSYTFNGRSMFIYGMVQFIKGWVKQIDPNELTENIESRLYEAISNYLMNTTSGSRLPRARPAELGIQITDNSLKNIHRLRDAFHEAGRVFAKQNTADLRPALLAAQEINKNFKTSLSQAQIISADGGLIDIFQRELQRYVFLPAGYVFGANFGPKITPTSYLGIINNDTWEEISYLGKSVWAVDVEFEATSGYARPGGVSIDEFAFVDSKQRTKDAISFYQEHLRPDGAIDSFSFQKLKSVLEKADIHTAEQYGEFDGKIHARHEEIEHSKDSLFGALLSATNLNIDPDNVPLLFNLGSDAFLKSAFKNSPDFYHRTNEFVQIDHHLSLIFDQVVKEYSGQLRGAIRLMEEYLDLAKRKTEEKDRYMHLAYAAFVNFIVIRSLDHGQFLETIKRAENFNYDMSTIYSLSSRLLFTGVSQINPGIQSNAAIFDFTEQGPEHPAERALIFLKQIYDADFLGENKRIEEVASRLAEATHDLETVIEFLVQSDPLPAKADLLFIPGNDDLQVLEEAAKIHDRVETVLVSGGNGRLTKPLIEAIKKSKYASIIQGDIDRMTEAAIIKEVLIANGVPENKLLLEEEATNTPENFKNGKKLIETMIKNRSSIESPYTIIYMTTPLQQLRTKATFEKVFAGKADVQGISYVAQSTIPNAKKMSPKHKGAIIDFLVGRRYKDKVQIGELEKFAIYADKGSMEKVELPRNVEYARFRLEIFRTAEEEQIQMNDLDQVGILIGGLHIVGEYYYPLVQRAMQKTFGDQNKLVYLPFPIEEAGEAAKQRVLFMKQLLRTYPQLAGFLITRPHKQSFTDAEINLSPMTQAVNVVVRSADEKLVADAIDGQAWINAMRRDLGQQNCFSGKKLVILGSGGAAREIAVALSSLGEDEKPQKITFNDMSQGRRVDMVAMLSSLNPGYQYKVLEEDRKDVNTGALLEAIKEADIVVNATGVGRGATQGQSPLLHSEVLNGVPVVCDLISNKKTRILEDAEEQGVRHVINGTTMFIFIMVETIKRWMDSVAPGKMSGDKERQLFEEIEAGLQRLGKSGARLVGSSEGALVNDLESYPETSRNLFFIKVGQDLGETSVELPLMNDYSSAKILSLSKSADDMLVIVTKDTQERYTYDVSAQALAKVRDEERRSLSDAVDITEQAFSLHEANRIPVSKSIQPTAKVVLVDSFPDLPNNAFYQSLILRFGQTLAKGSQVVFVSQEPGRAKKIAALARTLAVKNSNQFVAMSRVDLAKIELPTSYLVADTFLKEAKERYGKNQKYLCLQSPDKKYLVGVYALTPLGMLMDFVSLEDWERAAQVYSQILGRNVDINELRTSIDGTLLIPFVSKLIRHQVAQVYMAERALGQAA